MTLGIVHAYSTHNLLLRYWLATAGIEAGKDVKLAVVPPARAVEALSSGQITGFCAGAPWGEVARRAGTGTTIATSRDIWRNAPEKAFAVRARWAEDHSNLVAGAMRALLRAAKFCDRPENASYTAAVLSRRKYLDVDPHAILASLPGGRRRPTGAASSSAAVQPSPGVPTDCGSSARCGAGGWLTRAWIARTGGTRLPAGPLPSRSRTSGRASAHTGMEARRRAWRGLDG